MLFVRIKANGVSRPNPKAMARRRRHLEPVAGPTTFQNHRTGQPFSLMAYRSGIHMYPDVSETAAFVPVTKAQAEKNKVDHEGLMAELVQLAKSIGAKRLHIYNFDGRDVKFETYRRFIIKGSDNTPYPEFDVAVRNKLCSIDKTKQPGDTLVMLDISYVVHGYSAAEAIFPSVPLSPRIVALVDENKAIASFVTGILACKYVNLDKHITDWEQHHPAEAASMNYEYLIGAPVDFTEPAISRTGRLAIQEASLLPQLKGEAARRQQLEHDAAQKIAKEQGFPVHCHFVPVPDWNSASPEQYQSVARDAMAWGTGDLVAMHCASSYGRTSGMLQAAVAAVSPDPLRLGRNTRAITEAIVKMYERESSEFFDFDRPRNALTAAQHVFTDHAKAQPPPPQEK